jgi:hypothetical protein
MSVSLRRLLSLVLVLVITSVLSSCVFITRMFDDDTPSTGPRSAEGVERVTRADGGSSTLVVRAELQELSGRTAYEVVEILNQRWLQIRRGVSLRDGPLYARVVVDEITRRELDELHRWNADEIEYMRYLTGPDATIKYGGGFPGGVIEVITRDGR